MENINFTDAEKNVSVEEIEKIISLSKKSSSFTSKIIISIFFAGLISLPPMNYYFYFSLTSVVVLVGLLIKYLSLNSFHKVVSYNFFIYSIFQTGIIFFLTVFLYVKTDKYHLIPWIYVIISYCSSYFIVHFKTTSFLRKEYNITPKKAHKRSELLTSKISKMLQVFLALVVLGMFLYRVNRWWLMNVTVMFENTSFWEYLLWGVALFVLLIGITLLPTLIFSPEKATKRKLLIKYSEEFREYYGYKKKEWYGE